MASLLSFLTPIGAFSAGSGSSISFGLDDNGLYAALNDVGTTFSAVATNPNGVFISSRFGALASQKALYVNGGAITVNVTDPAVALTALSISILAENRGPVSRFLPGTVHAAAIGASMAGKESGFNNAWNKYKTKWLAHPYDRILSYAALNGYAPPSAPQQAKQRKLIDDLMLAGIWDKLDVFYNFYTNGSESFAGINWKNPGAFQITKITSGAPITFSINAGFQAHNSLSYLSGGFGGANGVNFKNADASVFFETAGPSASPAVMGAQSLDNQQLAGIQEYGVDQIYWFIGRSVFGGLSYGYSSFEFTSLNGVSEKLFKNGSQIDAQTQSGSTVSGVSKIFIHGYNNNSGGSSVASNNYVSVVGIGDSLVGKEAALFNAWITYKSAAAYSEIIEFAVANGYVLPSAQQQEAGQLLIYDMMNIGAWDRMDVFYNFYTDGDANFATINWKNPYASTLLAPAGGITFTANDGAAGDGLVGYIDTGIIPGVNTEKLTLNSAGVFMDVNNVTPGTKALFGSVDPGVGTVVFYPSVGGMSVSRAANETDITWTAPNPANGFWLLERNAVDEVQSFLNYDMRVNSSLPSTALPGFALYLFAANNAGVPADYSDATIRCFGLGGSLKQVESRLYQAWETYKARAV